jgi:16S rRNA G966 N2-methylase RsmD
MRIIAGSLKGRRIDAPDWNGLRPTSDKLRETLFNVVAPWIAGARLLDGYAGTGAVGIEALSRGAAHVTFVERDPRALKLIQANLEQCGIAEVRRRRGDVRLTQGPEAWLPPRAGEMPHAADAEDRYAIIRAGFADARKRLGDARFDLIFLDPPYGHDDLLAGLKAAIPFVGEGTRLIVEHAKRDEAPAEIEGLTRVREVLSGDSALAFYTLDRT